ncbi:MAG: XdhC family protein [Gemmatimonadota bacterium]|nr:XdhC family protein [Gemmatimonadota bacterium]
MALFPYLDQLRGTERRVAMATLVAAKGTTPKKAGAKMWVGDGGRILGSVTIGGCVDARVIEQADEVIATGRPALLSLSLADEEAWDIGLTCGGSVDVLLEALDVTRADDPVLTAFDAVERERNAGRGSVIVTPLGVAGSRVVVRADSSRIGSLGESALDDAATAAAMDVLRAGTSRAVRLAPGEGPADHFLELHAPPTTLIVFGATHVAMPLVAMARELGWHITVVDARERFATRERFPNADVLRVGMVAEIAESMRYTPATAVVLTAHDYKFEMPVLKAVLASDAGYVGLLGNRRRGAALLEFLAGDGVSAESLKRVRVPVGLDIGAMSAEEIAVSIIAEIISIRPRRRPSA